MFRNKKFVIALCVVLTVALGVLIYLERTNPEAGSEFIQGLMR